MLAVLKIGVSCEKVIDVSINDAESLIVIEGVLKNFTGKSYIKLSKSGSVYDDSGFEKISNANVVVTDNLGNSYLFTEDPEETGKYIYPSFTAFENSSYSLKVEVGNQTFTAVSSSRTLPTIDSITYTLESFAGNEFYLPYYHSVDNGQEQNQYRLRIWINGEETEIYYLGDDQFINGQYYAAQFFGTAAEMSDTISIEMLEMDEKVFDYFYGLSNEADNGSFSPAPGNPISNIEGGALGFFGVFMTDTASVVIQ